MCGRMNKHASHPGMRPPTQPHHRAALSVGALLPLPRPYAAPTFLTPAAPQSTAFSVQR